MWASNLSHPKKFSFTKHRIHLSETSNPMTMLTNPPQTQVQMRVGCISPSVPFRPNPSMILASVISKKHPVDLVLLCGSPGMIDRKSKSSIMHHVTERKPRIWKVDILLEVSEAIRLRAGQPRSIENGNAS